MIFSIYSVLTCDVRPIRNCSDSSAYDRPIADLALAHREIILEEVPDASESVIDRAGIHRRDLVRLQRQDEGHVMLQRRECTAHQSRLSARLNPSQSESCARRRRQNHAPHQIRESARSGSVFCASLHPRFYRTVGRSRGGGWNRQERRQEFGQHKISQEAFSQAPPREWLAWPEDPLQKTLSRRLRSSPSPLHLLQCCWCKWVLAFLQKTDPGFTNLPTFCRCFRIGSIRTEIGDRTFIVAIPGPVYGATVQILWIAVGQ